MNIKNAVTKKTVLTGLGIIIIIAIIIGLFIFFQNGDIENKKTVSPPPAEHFSLSDCVFAELVQADSELNIDLSKTNIFGEIYTFLKPFSDQKKMRILGMKIKREEKVLNLEELIFELDIDIPDEVAEKTGKRYFLAGFFSQLENKEWELKSLGLILETMRGEEEAIKESLKEWEETMAKDVAALALVKNKENLPLEKFGGIEFQDGDYNDVAIRYCALPFNLKNSKAIDYIFTDDKVFITTSRESIYAVIDLLE